MFKLNSMQDKMIQFFLYVQCCARKMAFVSDKDVNVTHKFYLESQTIKPHA